MSPVSPIPEGFHSVSPALVIKGAAEAIEFYKQAFGAEVIMNLTGPHGSIMHAELKIGDSMIMLGDEFPGHHVQSPTAMKGTTITLHIYVADVDAAHKQALAAGAKETMPPVDMFWGDRFSSVMDPYGHSWSLATHTRDVPPDECQKAADEWLARMTSGEGCGQQ